MWRPLLLLSLVCTCVPLPFDQGSCAPVSDLVPGTYVSKGGRWGNAGSSRYPHAEAGGKTLVLERLSDDKARVRITYSRGGKAIVETWQDDGSHPPIHWAPRPQPPIVVTLTPAAADFGAVEIGGSRLVYFTAQNASTQGSPQLVVSGTGAGFVFTHTCGALVAGGKCTIGVDFRPMTVGASNGLLAVNIGAGAAVLTATLKGVGVLGDASPAAPDAQPDAAPPVDASPIDEAGLGDDAGPDAAGDTAASPD